jgi:hypothetical protein
MAVHGIEDRVAALEAEMVRVKAQLEKAVPAQRDWLDDIYGAFEGDPIFEEAMRLGREYRESLRPKPRSKQSKRAQSAKEKKQ